MVQQNSEVKHEKVTQNQPYSKDDLGSKPFVNNTHQLKYIKLGKTYKRIISYVNNSYL